MRKKALIVTAMAMTSALALAGCAGDTDAGEAPAEKSTVTLWMYPVIPDENKSRDYWEGVEKNFESENENIDLVIDLLPWDNRDEKIATAIASGSGPDIVLLTADQTLNYQTMGGLKPVTEGLDSKDAFFEGGLGAVTFDGDVYGVPIYNTSTTAVYNKALFEAAGVSELPTTWDEIMDAAPKLAANGVAIMDYSGSPQMTLNLSFYPLLWQSGGSVFTKDGKDVAFDGPEGVAALQFLLDLQAVGGLPVDAATKPNGIEGGGLGNGVTAMGYALVKPEVAIMETAHPGDVVVGLPLTGEKQVTFGSVGALALTTINKDENEAAALKVMNYLASPEISHELNVVSGTYPARTDTASPGDDEITKTFVEALQFATPGEVYPNARQVMAALAPHLQAALQGQKTAQQALSDAAAEARDIIANAG